MQEVKVDSIPCGVFQEHCVVAVRRADEELYCMLFITPCLNAVRAVWPGPHTIFLKDATETKMTLNEAKLWAMFLRTGRIETFMEKKPLSTNALTKLGMNELPK